MQWLSRFGGFQLRAKFLHNSNIVGILISVDHHQRMSIRLAEYILCLMNLVGCVHRNKNRADLGGRPKGNEPLRDISGPDGYMIAWLNA